MKNDASALIDGNADTLFLEKYHSTGLTIGSSTDGEGAIQFSDSDDAPVGKIQYAHSSEPYDLELMVQNVCVSTVLVM
jgi:hypothetical protein